jgi:hypothetical protein
MRSLLFLSLLLTFAACNDTKKPKHTSKNIVKANTQDLADIDTSAAGSKKNLINFEKGKVSMRKKLSSGIVLKWI